MGINKREVWPFAPDQLQSRRTIGSRSEHTIASCLKNLPELLAVLQFIFNNQDFGSGQWMFP